MRVFVDTSAFLALMDAGDQWHTPAQQVWAALVEDNTTFISTNYVMLETITLVQSRLGMTALLRFYHMVMPHLSVEWVDEAIHQAGIELLIAANQRRLSLVDCSSFAAMRHLGLDSAFAFDRHFADQGFVLLG